MFVLEKLDRKEFYREEGRAEKSCRLYLGSQCLLSSPSLLSSYLHTQSFRIKTLNTFDTVTSVRYTSVPMDLLESERG